MTHLLVGMYIQEVALCALFFLARNAAGKVSAIPQGVLMIILIVATVSHLVGNVDMTSTLHRQAAFHYVIHDSYGPLKKSLPLSLAYLSHGMPKEEGHEGSILEGSDAEFDPRPTAVKRQSQLHRNETGDETPDTDEEGAAFERYSDTSEDRQRLHTPSLPAENEKQVEMADLGRSRTDGVPRQKDDSPQQPALTSEEREAQQAHQDAARKSMEEQAEATGNSAVAQSADAPPVHPVDYALTNAEAHGTDDPVQHSATKESAAERSREDYDVDAFAHPATKEPQRIIWLPEDELGLAVAEVKDNLSVGITATTKDAVLDSKVSLRPFDGIKADQSFWIQGKVEIFGPPPDHFEGTDE